MPEFSLRNKTSPTPTLTLSKAVMGAMMDARPESSSLVLAKLKKDYLALTGKVFRLDPDQEQALLFRYGATDSGRWVSAFSKLPHPLSTAVNAFVSGFLSGTVSQCLLADLEVAEAFYGLLPAPR